MGTTKGLHYGPTMTDNSLDPINDTKKAHTVHGQHVVSFRVYFWSLIIQRCALTALGLERAVGSSS